MAVSRKGLKGIRLNRPKTIKGILEEIKDEKNYRKELEKDNKNPKTESKILNTIIKEINDASS